MNIEGWTLGGLVALTSVLIVLISNLKRLSSELTVSLTKIIKKEIEPLEGKIDAMSKQIDSVEAEATKNFLVTTIGEIERNGWTDETTKQRLYEEMERYEELGGNSYVHARFEQLKKEGKI